MYGDMKSAAISTGARNQTKYRVAQQSGQSGGAHDSELGVQHKCRIGESEAGYEYGDREPDSAQETGSYYVRPGYVPGQIHYAKSGCHPGEHNDTDYFTHQQASYYTDGDAAGDHAAQLDTGEVKARVGKGEYGQDDVACPGMR